MNNVCDHVYLTRKCPHCENAELEAKLQAAEVIIKGMSDAQGAQFGMFHNRLRDGSGKCVEPCGGCRAEAAEAERDEMKERFGWTYCAYCGDRFPADAPESVERIAEHIHECVKHPIGKIVKENTALQAEVARLKGITPELPPCPPMGAGMPRYGVRWNGPTKPLAVPMDDGYWTPWHLADRLQAEVARLNDQSERMSKMITAQRGLGDGYRTRIAELEAGLPLLYQIDEYLDKHPYPALDADIHWGVFHRRVKNHLAALLGEG